MYVNNLLRKRGLKLYKKYFEFLSIPSKFFKVRVFRVIKYSTTANQLKYISFGGHQSQTVERIKTLYNMHKCMLIIF